MPQRKSERGAPPLGLEAHLFESENESFVVLSYPLPAPQLPASLTKAERAVVELALQGLRTLEIAARRGVAQRTVSNLLQRAYRKLGVSSRAELAALVAELGPERGGRG